MSTITPLSILGTAAASSQSTTSTSSLTVLGFATEQSQANESASGSASGGLFGVLSSAADTGSAVQNILSAEQTQQSQTAYYDNIANYITALQTGQLKLSATSPSWQTDASYLQQTGQPFVVTADSKGNIQALPESQADLSRYSPAQQSILTASLGQLSSMAQAIQANTQNQNWVDALASVEPTLQAIHAGDAVPVAGWQSEAADLAATGTPFTVGLDSKGNIIVQNQFEGDFSGVPASEQATLASAVAQLQTALQTGIAGNAWEAQALSDAEEGQDYYLGVDATTGNIVVNTNTAANITPAFLQTPPYPDIGANTPWLQQAANYIQQGVGFYLDIAGNDQVIVRQNNGAGINTWNRPQSQTAQNPVIDLLA